MIKFVTARPIKKIQRTREYTNNPTQQGLTKKKKIPLKTIWIIFISFTLLYWAFILFKSTLLNKSYVIAKIQYYVKDVKIYNDPVLYKEISAQIKQENYNVVRFQKNDLLAKLQERYPFIKDMKITFIADNVVRVKLVFQDPELIIRNQLYKFGVFRGHIFPILSGNALGQNTKILDLPGYLSGQLAMTGLFFRQSADTLIQQLDLIYQWFPKLERVEYLPGGERTIVYINKQRIYLNNLGNIAEQISTYMLLKKYYPETANLKEIDIGSLEKDKLIVRK